MTDTADSARKHDDAFNAHDAAARRACEASDIAVVLPGGIELHGPDQVLGMVMMFWEGMPDVHLTIHSTVEQGDAIAVEGTLSGHHTGPIRAPQGEIPPSGNFVQLRYAGVKRIRDGKLASENLYFDQLEFLQQVGAMPGPA